jgi:hypothetical protein
VPDGPSSWALRPRGNVARVVRSRQGELRLGAQANWIGYRSQEALNRYSADVSLDGTYRTSVHTTWQLGGAYQVGYSDHSRVLDEQGVMLPLVRTRTSAAKLAVGRAVGLQTTLHVDGRFYRTDFDQQDIDTYGLREGQSMRGTASLDHRLGLRNTAAIEYSLEAVDRQDRQPYETHFGSLRWNYLLRPRSALLVQAGASNTPDAAEAGLERQTYFFGGASYGRQVGSSSITLVARREVVPAFGSGLSRIQDRFGLSARIPIRQHWTLQLAGTHRRSGTPEGSATDYGDRNEASAALSRRLGKHFEVSGEGRYRHRAATSSQPMIDQFVGGVFLTLVGAPGASGSRSAP